MAAQDPTQTTPINPVSTGPQPHLTANGRVSAKYAPGRTWRRQIRIENIARLCSSGLYNHTQIANHLGIARITLAQLKNTKEFQAKMIECTTGVISSFDKDLREDITNSKEELASMVPAALLQLRNSLLSKNENIRMKAVSEVLDREGTLSKVSRTSVSLDTKTDLTKAVQTGQDLLSLLQSATPTSQDQMIDVSTNGSFSMNAVDARQQAKDMRNVIDEKTIEEIDEASLSVQ